MPITINGLNITDNIKYLVEEVTYKGMPSRNIVTETIATRPGDKLISYEWGSKEISMKGRVFGSTPTELQTNVDTLQKYLSPGFIAVSIDTDRTYTATLSEMDIPTQFYNLSMVEYEATFVCIDPFAYGPSLSISGSTVSGTTTYSGSLTVYGTAFAEPTLTIVPAGLNAGNSGMKVIQVINKTTGEGITLSGVFNYNSELVIDYGNFYVTNSGNQSDYQGIFSRFEPGTNTYEITISSGVVNSYNWKWSYRPRYFQ